MIPQQEFNPRIVRSVLGASIDPLDWRSVLETIHSWASLRESRYICICNVHSVVTTRYDPAFNAIVNGADMATPDGAPVAWLMRRIGASGQERINGPDLMWKYCAEAATRNESIFLYGGSQTTLDALQARLAHSFPNLNIAGAFSPPFRDLTLDEDEQIIDMINRSGAGTVWVSLGCPKQEKWMAEHRGRIQAVMIGVGAAFDYHAGTIRRAPLWMQNRGLEWAYRLGSEPRRLWKRYLITNSLFLCHASFQVLMHKASLGASVITAPSFLKRADP